MPIYLYIMTHNTGMAPNYDQPACTLACCSKFLRQTVGKNWDTAREPIWVGGLVGVTLRNRLFAKYNISPAVYTPVYLMRVDTVLTFEKYWNSPRFSGKKPGENNTYGDNYYHSHLESAETAWNYSNRKYFKHGNNKKIMQHDLNGQYVLAGSHWYNFDYNFPDEDGFRRVLDRTQHWRRYIVAGLDSVLDYVEEHDRSGAWKEFYQNSKYRSSQMHEDDQCRCNCLTS